LHTCGRRGSLHTPTSQRTGRAPGQFP